MSSKILDSTEGGKERDPDFINAEIALNRAARKARQRAFQAGIGVIVLQGGQIIEERPDQMEEGVRNSGGNSGDSILIS